MPYYATMERNEMERDPNHTSISIGEGDGYMSTPLGATGFEDRQKKIKEGSILSSLVQASLLVTQDIEKCFLRKIDCAHSLHSSFTLFLIFEMLHLPFIMSCTKNLIIMRFSCEDILILTSIKASSNIRSHGFQSLSSDNFFAN